MPYRNFYPCSVEGCTRPRKGKGLCATHYQRLRMHGDPSVCLTDNLPAGTALAWLQEQILQRSRSDCWAWPFSMRYRDYGVLRYLGQNMNAAGVALILTGHPRPDPPTNHLIHACDNPPCVNPDHLRWGTHQENMADKMAKNRHAYGEKIGRGKLTDEDVRAIRKDHRTQEAVAASYGVTHRVIGKIRNGSLWKHVE